MQPIKIKGNPLVYITGNKMTYRSPLNMIGQFILQVLILVES